MMYCRVSYKEYEDDKATFYTILPCEDTYSKTFIDFMNDAIANNWVIVKVQFGENLF